MTTIAAPDPCSHVSRIMLIRAKLTHEGLDDMMDHLDTCPDRGVIATPDNPDWEGMTGSEIVKHEFGCSNPTCVLVYAHDGPCCASCPHG